ncbi:MAG: type IV toxin-antitoxin system AbiEi family antitoxin domain-containing protein [Myxococcaceae bacterium]
MNFGGCRGLGRAPARGMSLRQRANKYASVARRQAGVFSLSQATAKGLSRKFIHEQVAANVLTHLGRGVYCVNGVPSTFELRVWAACLEANGFASHRTAGWVWGLDGLGATAPELLEVVVPLQSHRKAKGTRVRRSRTLAPDHIYDAKGPPRTNVARTLIDLSEILGPDELELAFDSALRRVRVFRPWITTLLAGLPTRGHRNIKRLLELVRSDEPALESAFEVQLRQLMRRSGIPTPTCQYRVREQGRIIARLDFAWPQLTRPVALLAHGFRWHGKRKRWKYDLQQVSALNRLGWCVIQCTTEALADSSELLADLRAVLPSPTPPTVRNTFHPG